MKVKELIGKWEENFEKMEKDDREAKGSGLLVGRYLREPFADGRAYYLIVKENRVTVVIRVVTGVGDDWRIPYWGDEATIRKDYAVQSITQRDRLDGFFSKKED